MGNLQLSGIAGSNSNYDLGVFEMS